MPKNSYQKDIRENSEDLNLHSDFYEMLVMYEADSPQSETFSDEREFYLVNSAESELRKMLNRDFRRSNIYSPNSRPKLRKS